MPESDQEPGARSLQGLVLDWAICTQDHKR